MEDHERLVLLSRYYESIGIPMCLFRKNGEIRATFPELKGAFMPPEYLEYCMNDFFYQKRDRTNPLILVFDPSFMVGIAEISEDEMLVFGPSSFIPHTREDVFELCRYVIYPDRLLEFCDILVMSPVMPFRRFASSFSLVVFLLNGLTIPIEHIVLCNATATEAPTVDSNMPLQNAREYALFHTPTDYEKEVLSAIRRGSMEMLRKKIIAPVTGNIGCMSLNPLTQEKYVFIVFCSLVTRAAIDGGLPSETAFSLSDVYCQRMDDMVNIQDIQVLIYNMALDFCGKVAERNAKSYSVAVKRCLDYVDKHLHEEIRLENFAQATGLSSKSISQKFKAETGSSLSEYLHGERLKEAKYLLKSSERSIAEIGSYLQYNSQSYFSKVFRARYSLTPQQYRDSKNADQS